MVQKKTSGCRYSQQKAMLISPFTKKAPNIHDDMSDGASPPRVPTARMIATGPEAAKMNATRPFTKYTPPKSARTPRKAGDRPRFFCFLFTLRYQLDGKPWSVPGFRSCERARRPCRCSRQA